MVSSFYVVSVLALFAFSCKGGPVTYKPPAFCRGLECPTYTVVKKTDDFEERCYQAYKWATTDVSGVDYDEAGVTGFMRLFNYIQGKNKQKVKIPMTAPVVIEIMVGPGSFLGSNFTVNFFVPFEDQDNPPEPTEEDVYITTFEKHCQYVAVYPGFSSSTLVGEEAVKLSKALDKAGLGSSYYRDSYFSAGYDSPWQLFNRHNEVWFLKKKDNLIN